jgi:exoribonuclease-2
VAELLEVVVFEKRGALGLAAVRAQGARQLDLVDAEGATLKLDPARVLHRLARRVEGGDPRALKARLRALREELPRGLPPCDPDALWDRLEEERAYDLPALAEAWYGARGDAEVVACLEGLCEGARLAEALRLRPDGFRRTEAQAWVHIRARRQREAERRAAEDAFLAWYEPLRAGQPGGAVPAPPAGPVAAELERMRSWALQAEAAPETKLARHLAGRLAWSDADEALAELERVGLLPRHVNEVPARLGLRVEPPAEVRAAAERLALAPAPPGGLDLRDLPTVAIDDAGTREVDDALSVWEEQGTTRVAIHIARLADCVRPGDPLDREAVRRATTVYFPGEFVPMLPLALAEGRWSLLQGRERPALSLLFELDGEGQARGLSFARTRVRVRSQVGYELEGGDALGREVVERLLPFARALREGRRARGAVLIDLPHVKLRFDAAGDPYPLLSGREGPAHVVVSELMVLYNAFLAETLAGAGVAALFRAQPQPLAAPGAGPAALPPDHPLVPVFLRRSMPPTQVGPEPGPHRTVGVEAYLQATSPIRRYGDLLAQRQLLAHLDGVPPPHDAQGVRALQAELEPAERRARQAEDERERYLVCHWLARQREPLPGWITRVDARRVSAWIPALGRELPCRVEPGQAPPLASEVRLRVLRAVPRQRVVDLELLPVG